MNYAVSRILKAIIGIVVVVVLTAAAIYVYTTLLNS